LADFAERVGVFSLEAELRPVSTEANPGWAMAGAAASGNMMSSMGSSMP
jgi:hypothetical protein